MCSRDLVHIRLDGTLSARQTPEAPTRCARLVGGKGRGACQPPAYVVGIERGRWRY